MSHILFRVSIHNALRDTPLILTIVKYAGCETEQIRAILMNVAEQNMAQVTTLRDTH